MPEQMRYSRLLLLFLLLTPTCFCASEEEQIVELPEIPDANGYKPKVLEKQIDDAAKYIHAPRPQPTSASGLTFLVIISPALARSGDFCIYGALRPKQGNQSAEGDLTIIRANAGVFQKQNLRLTAGQTEEVRDWFESSRFLDPKEKNALPPTVFDGVSMWIEIFQGKKTFQFYRNAYDNPDSEKFFTEVTKMEVRTRLAIQDHKK